MINSGIIVKLPKIICYTIFLMFLIDNNCEADKTLHFVPYGKGIKNYGKVEVVGESWKGNKNDWPATFKAINESNKIVCTATLIGPSALLTAAHCLIDFSSFKLIPNDVDEPIPMKCRIPENYDDGSNDYALCQLGEQIDVKLYESIKIDPINIKKGNRILLAGFGCRTPPQTDKFWLGYAAIESLPGQAENSQHANYFSTIGSENNSGLSLSDSGGCTYLVNGSDRNIHSRVCIAIASHKNSGNDCGPQATTSLLTSLSSKDGHDFVSEWEKDKVNGAGICGVTAGMKKCRN